MWYHNIGITLSFFISILVFAKKNKSKSDWILSFWMLVSGFHLLFYYLFVTGKYVAYSFLLGLESPIPLMHGPFLYLYVKAASKFRVKGFTILVHLILPIAFYVYLIQFFSLSSIDKIEVYQSNGKEYQVYGIIKSVLIQISGIVYVLLSLKVLYAYRKTIKDSFSNIERIQFNWLLYLIMAISMIWLAVIFGNDHIVFFMAVIHTCIIGYIGINYVGILSTAESIDSLESKLEENLNSISIANIIDINDTTKSISKDKYEKSSLSELEAQQIHSSLVELMSIKKLFTNPDLSLTYLANELDITPNILSQVINSKMNCNFYDYINKLRIEEFKRIVLFPENKDFTLLTIAFDCGYNSKTSFNRNFKNIVGISPSEYLDQIKTTNHSN